jgi:hypothetical protein
VIDVGKFLLIAVVLIKRQKFIKRNTMELKDVDSRVPKEAPLIRVASLCLIQGLCPLNFASTENTAKAECIELVKKAMPQTLTCQACVWTRRNVLHMVTFSEIRDLEPVLLKSKRKKLDVRAAIEAGGIPALKLCTPVLNGTDWYLDSILKLRKQMLTLLGQTQFNVMVSKKHCIP